jgi:hypothetical protein
MLGVPRTPAVKLTLWQDSSPTPLACTICMAMSGIG